MNKNLVASLFLILVSTTGMAQTENGKGNLFKKIESFATRNMVHGVDTNYVKTPSRPWQVSIRTRVSQTDLDMHSRIDGESVFDGTYLNPGVKGTGVMETDPRFITQVSTSLGVKVGYRGLSASYSFHISGHKGQSIALKSAGSWYSLNVRWHKFKMTTPTVRFAGQMYVRDDEQSPWEGPESYEFKDKMPLESPIKISTLMFDGFYIFNRKKFSYAAAYTQKTFQVRSAGSFLAGLTAYYADFDYSNSRNADFFAAMDDIGRLRQYQVSVGAGYAYNFVPAKGWVLSAMFMPTVTVLNRTKVNTFKTNYKEIDSKHELDYDDDYADEYEITEKGSHSHGNKIALNFNTRVSITYNWDRYFINANGQFDNYNFKHSGLRGHLNDWYINASVGVRL